MNIFLPACKSKKNSTVLAKVFHWVGKSEKFLVPLSWSQNDFTLCFNDAWQKVKSYLLIKSRGLTIFQIYLLTLEKKPKIGDLRNLFLRNVFHRIIKTKVLLKKKTHEHFGGFNVTNVLCTNKLQQNFHAACLTEPFRLIERWEDMKMQRKLRTYISFLPFANSKNL